MPESYSSHVNSYRAYSVSETIIKVHILGALGCFLKDNISITHCNYLLKLLSITQSAPKDFCLFISSQIMILWKFLCPV